MYCYVLNFLDPTNGKRITKLLHLFSSFARKFAGIKRMIAAKVQDRKPSIVKISNFIIFTLFLIDRERDALLRFSRS